MTKDFLLAEKGLIGKNLSIGLNRIFENDRFVLFGEKIDYANNTGHQIYICGYVLPRNDNSKTEQVYGQSQVVFDLYNKYGEDFTSYIKGIYTIVIIDGDSIKIYNDHLGLSKFFYSLQHNGICISNNYKLITSITGFNKLNHEALAVKSLLNREVNGETFLLGISYSTPATAINISNDTARISHYWSIGSLLEKDSKSYEIPFFAELFKANVENNTRNLKPKHTAITLTGGKDSRTALAALLSQGIKPLGLTYGNPDSIDAVFSKKMASAASLEHIIVEPDRSKEWFEKVTQHIIDLNNPLINIHRGHRLESILKLQEKLGSSTSYYSGYMGGELLMGIYFDNLIFTNFIKNFWDVGDDYLNKIPELIQNNFIRPENVDLDKLTDQLHSLKAFDTKLGKKGMQFHSLFEIGVLHHSQDIQIAQHYLDYPIPFFLDIEFLESLFQSRFSFLSQNVETKNIYKRHSLFEFNLKLQNLLCPQLDKVYFAKRGTYNTSEFLKGPLYWSIVKMVRYVIERKKYPPTFTYNQEYRTFLINHLKEIILDNNCPINGIYNVELALKTLESQTLITNESPLHRYSNIVMHYLQYKKMVEN